jgi:DNA repair exonuclease SbcCD ATPase subunit
MTEPVDSRVHADLALAIYLEPLAEDRRVLLLGDARGPLAERLDAVSRRLDIIDPAAREPSRGPVPELPFRDATFDLVLVSDVSALPDPRPDAMRELRRVLADNGTLAACLHAGARKRRRGGPPEEVLDRLLAPQFRYVRTYAQTSVFGHGFGALEGGNEEDFAIDSSLLRGERAEPERVLALASDARLEVEARLWVQVPEGARAQGAESGVSFEQLHRLEDEAREAAQREAEALRELETERRARADAEHRVERAQKLERRLRDAEGDYDDAVARLRFLERELSEREGLVEMERKRRETVEQELGREKAQVLGADARVRAAEEERDAARADAEARQQELAEVEARLKERAEQIREIERTRKEKEVIARDLLEELRRLEQHKTADVEHDARVAELEAERDRAVQRALEAEVAREAAQMRVDELRAQLAEPGHEPVRPHDPELEGTVRGLRMRVSELEQRLADFEVEAVLPKPFVETTSALPPPAEAAELLMLRGRVLGLELRIAEGEKAVAAAEARASSAESSAAEARALASVRVMPPPPPPVPAFVGAFSEPPREVDRALEDSGRGERLGLALRLSETEAALAALRAAQPASPAISTPAPAAVDVDALLSAERARHSGALADLEARVAELTRRSSELERELEEADRFTESHAEDESRIEALEFELEAVRRRLDGAEDDLRSTEDALRAARADAEHASLEASARVELAQRRESDARQERDSTRAALEEARAMLAQLAQQSGVNEPS